METNIIAKESGHFYYRDGRPAYEMPYAKSNKAKAGQFRATTKGDAKKHDLVGSVTAMDKQLYKFNLERWKQEQILESAYTCPVKRSEVSGKEWIAKVFEDAQEHAKVTAEEGKQIHSGVEDGIKGKQVNPKYKQRYLNVLDILKSYGVDTTDLESEKTFACDLWGGFGGMTDLLAAEKAWLGDLKTKDFILVDGKPHKMKDGVAKPYQLHYEENCLQLVMNAIGQGILSELEISYKPFPTLINIYISRIDDSVWHHQWDEKTIKKCIQKAELLVKLFWVDF